MLFSIIIMIYVAHTTFTVEDIHNLLQSIIMHAQAFHPTVCIVYEFKISQRLLSFFIELATTCFDLSDGAYGRGLVA